MPQDNDRRFPGVALVTGATSGIGRATALRLAAGGSVVVVGYHSNHDAAEQLIDELDGDGHMALRIAIDDTASITTAAQEIAVRYGKLDALVNNGGSTEPVPLDDLDKMTDEIFDRVLTINLRGPFAVIRGMRSLLEKGSNAAIINVSSLAAQRGVGSSHAYCAAKGGLDTLTFGLSRVLAPDIRVMSVSPAGVDTNFVKSNTRARLEAMAESMPLKKVTTPDDVAKAIIAAIVDLTSSTGVIITVDEGRHL